MRIKELYVIWNDSGIRDLAWQEYQQEEDLAAMVAREARRAADSPGYPFFLRDYYATPGFLPCGSWYRDVYDNRTSDKIRVYYIPDTSPLFDCDYDSFTEWPVDAVDDLMYGLRIKFDNAL